MATATPVFFQSWKEYKNEAVNAQSDTFIVGLCAAANAPVNTNTIRANLTEVAYTNCSTRTLTLAASSQTAGTYKLDFADLTLTASGGNVGPFRYVFIYDDTVTSDPLVVFADYGSDITLGDGESIDIVFNAAGLYTES